MSGRSDDEIRADVACRFDDPKFDRATNRLAEDAPVLLARALAAEAEVERLRGLVGTIYPCSHHEEIEWLNDVGRTVAAERDAALAREARLAAQIAEIEATLNSLTALREHGDIPYGIGMGWRGGVEIAVHNLRAALTSTGEPT